jgi:UDP-2,3-diacylglucosamine hydrolase
VSWYFASDIHLRLDHPERGRRFARFVDSLEPDDTLTIVGDLCDFWLAARELAKATDECPALGTLRAFRARGGAVTILPGNHDAWLGPYYRQSLGAQFVQEPLRVEAYGLRLLLVHGHLLGGRRPWKAVMESRSFLDAFRHCPDALARQLDRLLERSNGRRREADDLRHLAVYRRFATTHAADADVVVIGHIHRTVDDYGSRPRMIVLGGWHQQSSYLKVDASGATFLIEPDPTPIPC